MFEGVYCKEKNSNTVYESILIDNFNNCINSALNSQSCAENLSDSRSVEMNSASDHISDSGASSSDALVPLSTCVAGENVRATYSVDGKLYEAVVKYLYGKPPKIMARVRYHGYGNEEAVPVNVIFPSLGPTAIKEQIKRAELDDEGAELEDEQTGSDENITKEINWKKGMACRALYNEKDIIYEATVLEVNDNERTAYVEMLGYGTCFHAKFENMYESIPALREKQAVSAQKYIDEEIRQNKMLNCGDRPSPGLEMACNGARLKKNESNSSDFEKRVNVISNILKQPKLENIKEEVQSYESSTCDRVLKENESNCHDLEMKIDVTSEISKEPKPKCVNEKEHNSETLASGGALLKENKSNCLDLDTTDNVPADTSKEPKLESINEKVQSSETLASDGAHQKKNKLNGTDFETDPKLNNTISDLTDVLTENYLPLSLRSEEILQPESESEALACLLSANYLSGYYAGYYDCIRRRQNSDKI